VIRDIAIVPPCPDVDSAAFRAIAVEGTAATAFAFQNQDGRRVPHGHFVEYFRFRSDFDVMVEETVRWYVDHEPWWRAIKERSAEYQAYYAKQYGSR
jgi:hypothetical protein